MNIQAHCRLDQQSVKALTHVSMYKKHRPAMRLTIRLVLVGVFILMSVVGFILQADTAFMLLLATLSLLLAICVVHFQFPRAQYKALANMRDARIFYVFEDDVLKISTEAENYHGNSEVRYSLLTKVYETDAHFFLFETANQVLIVDKASIEGGTAEELRNKLCNTISGKYIRCRY